MNLIVCAKHCHYQKEGYCTLETPAQLTSQVDEGCAYYQSSDRPLPCQPEESHP